MKALLILSLSLLLVGCGGGVTVEPTPLIGVSPLPFDDSPVATAVVSAVVDYAPPTPAEGFGVITGRLGIENTDLPMAGVDVYLGDHIGSTEDTPLYGLDSGSAPRTAVDEDGRFVFVDVPPGRYVVVVWNSLSPLLARDPDSGEPLDIRLAAGQVIDLGLLLEPMP
jgi:ABC-type Fe3+-hydroxamate transport system substrate-binding protein